MQSSVMTTFCFKPPQQYCSSGGCRLPAAAAPSRPLIRQCSSSISWRWWWEHQRKHTTLQCRHGQQHSTITLGDLHEAGKRQSQYTCMFRPSIWGDFFLGYSNPAASYQEQAWLERADKLKEQVAMMIRASSTTCRLHERLHLIDALERLCLDHLFKEEISVEMTQFETADVSDCDLGTAAMWFYLLRKHGYRVSPDVFLRFKDEEGGFLANSPVELLNLYNAAHLRTHGEKILDEAKQFTGKHLEETLPYVEGSLAREIQSALEIPLARRVRIFESKYLISTYEKDATVNEKVLQLAKLNSNIMQLQHQRELKIVTSWWKDVKIESRLPFARDRITECYFWIVGVYFEPSYSRARIIMTMMIAIVTLLDDIYDSYGTTEECELFTKCIESWDPMVVHNLPECMLFALGRIFDSFQNIANMLHPDEKYRMMYLRNITKDLVRCYNTEVKMLERGYIPESVDEHLQLSLRSGGCFLLSCACFVGMDSMATKEFFDWTSSLPKMVQALCKILRLLDDLQSYEREKLTPHVASTIDSYMKEYNVSREVAREKIHELKEDSWKDLNDEWLSPDSTQPKQLLERIFNITRTMEFMYNKDEIFTNCENLEDPICSLLMEPLTIPI